MDITVIKLDHLGRESWRYSGQLVERGDHKITIEAFFDRNDFEFHGMMFCKGDRFIETYYDDRWYNILEIHDIEEDKLKGWYCNVGFPAEIENHTISYKDLALDLLVFPDGTQIVLDEDEFWELKLLPDERKHSLEALKELQTIFLKQITRGG